VIPIPDPLHPAVVHLPLALAGLMPLVALGCALAIRTGFVPARAWLAVVLLQALLAGSAWFATETGEDQEERVERVVDERFIEEHEEGAEWLLRLAVAGLVISAAGLLPGRLGGAGRLAAIAATAVVLAAALRVGHTGGQLVYEHGAASAYVDRATDAAD
jgi:hypothetical protein